jgi:NADH-quinone oxidoreductase subunit F
MPAPRWRRLVEPSVLIGLIGDAGLRGRGGAGFPTGLKWRTVSSYASPTEPTPVVVNAAEGEPGTFKDRAIVNENPYLVLEGALIAARAIGAVEVIIAMKASFTNELRRMNAAIAEVGDAGWLDGVTVRIATGPSEYLFGEETALLEVVEGRMPFPRVAPPFRRGLDPAHRPTGHSASGAPFAEQGGVGWFAPALVDNVETIANLAGIVLNGAAWYRAHGTQQSPGTIICTITGSTARHGVGEFAMGTPLREVIETLGGGLAEGRSIAAVLCGVSGPPVPGDLLDLPLTYEDFAAAGLGLGSASFIVVDDRVPLTRLARSVAHFLAVESCGQCEPCKRDGLALDDLLGADRIDTRAIASRLSTVNRGARCALAGQTERVVGALVDLAATRRPAGPWDDETMAIAPLVEIEEGRAVLDLAWLAKRPDWSYPEDGEESGAWPAQHLADHPVEIRAPHTPEPGVADSAERPTKGIDALFAPLLESHRRLEARLATLRAATAQERPVAVEEVREALEAHRRVTQRFLFPMVDRIRGDEGDLITGFPEHHELNALRLLERLRVDPASTSPRLIDDIVADVHATIIEIERKVLPALEHQLDEATTEELQAGIISELDAEQSTTP